MAANFGSASPASTSTGIVSSSSRSHSGVIAPVPSPRSAAASPAGSLRAMSARASRCVAGSSPAKSGCASQRSEKAAMSPASISSASRASAARRACPLRFVLDPRRRRDEDEPADPLRRGKRDVQRDPPAHRVPAQLEDRRRRVEHVLRDRLEADRAARPPASRGRGGPERAPYSVRRRDRRSPDPSRARCRRTRGEGPASRPSPDHAPCDRHLPAAARALRRARPLRDRGRGHLAGVALHSDRPVAGTQRRVSVLLPDRRAHRGVLRAGARQGDGSPGGARLHVRHGGCELPARRDRGRRGARSADRADGRPPARAARDRGRPDDRPAQALRRRRADVHRGRRPGRDPADAALDPHARLPRRLDGARAPSRPRASQPAAARAARARRAASGGRARRRRASRRASVGRAPSRRARRHGPLRPRWPPSSPRPRVAWSCWAAASARRRSPAS